MISYELLISSLWAFVGMKSAVDKIQGAHGPAERKKENVCKIGV